MMNKLFPIIIFVLLSSCIQEVKRENRPIIEPFGSPPPAVVPLTRPDDAVFIQPGSCACKDGEPAILGDCVNFCAQKGSTGGQTILYLTVDLGEEILLNSQLGTLFNWCNSVLSYENEEGETVTVGTNPACGVTLTDSDGNEIPLDATVKQNSKKVEVTLLSTVQFDKTYILRLVELESGAKSDTIQIRRITGFDLVDDLSPLKISPVSGYTCISKGYSVDENSGTIYYETAFKLHFYFVDWDSPPIIPPGTVNINCHDTNIYGKNDNALYPRLELTPGIFSIWDVKDPRFYDIDIDPTLGSVNGKKDIHDIIDAIIKSNGGSGLSFDIFYELQWPNFPQGSVDGDNSNPGGSNTPILGYIMAPWVDATTNISYCPTSTHYYGTNQTLKALRDVVGIDTEGLYLGVKEPESIEDQNGNVIGVSPDDYIIIREGLLRNIWFYFQNGQAIQPTALTEGAKTLHFYWPPNESSPYIKGADQKLYTIRHPQQISAGSLSGTSTSFASLVQIPHDKKFACAPKAD